jgi:hypothetical protein
MIYNIIIYNIYYKMSIKYNLFNSDDTFVDNIQLRNDYDNIIINNKNYNNSYKNMKNIINNKNNIYINFSSDKAISASTIASLNELYSYRCGQQFKSDLKIIYISPSSDMFLNNYDYHNNINNENNDIKYINYQKSVVSNLLSISHDHIKRSYTKHMLDLELDQFIFLGLQHIDDENILIESNCKYYTLISLTKKIKMILENILEDKNIPVAIIFDINAISSKIYNINNVEQHLIGFNMDQINIMLNILSKLNIKMIDIVGYDNKENLKLNLLINKIYLTLTKQKNTKINVFDENSRFLIYKPLSEIYEKEYDIGWYLLRNIPQSMNDELLHSIELDSIIMLEIPDDDNNFVEIMISSTNITEQNNKCYYISESYKDCCLYPDEKMAMCFEMIS